MPSPVRVVVQDPELRWKGEWDALTTYPKESVVGHNGSSYVASGVTQGDDPELGSPWSLLASKGDEGPQGPIGPSGNQAGTYVHTQSLPATIWVINHNLGSYPSVTIVDSAGTRVLTEVRYIDINTVESHTVAQFSGKAFLT